MPNLPLQALYTCGAITARSSCSTLIRRCHRNEYWSGFGEVDCKQLLARQLARPPLMQNRISHHSFAQCKIPVSNFWRYLYTYVPTHVSWPDHVNFRVIETSRSTLHFVAFHVIFSILSRYTSTDTLGLIFSQRGAIAPIIATQFSKGDVYYNCF